MREELDGWTVDLGPAPPTASWLVALCGLAAASPAALAWGWTLTGLILLGAIPFVAIATRRRRALHRAGDRLELREGDQVVWGMALHDLSAVDRAVTHNQKGEEVPFLRLATKDRVEDLFCSGERLDFVLRELRPFRTNEAQGHGGVPEELASLRRSARDREG